MRAKGFLLASAGVNSLDSTMLIPKHKRWLERLDARLSRSALWLLRWGRVLLLAIMVGVIAYFLLKRG